MAEDGVTTNVHQDVYKEKSTSLASSNQTCPPNNASMISRPTYARTADTDDMMKQAQRISEDHGGDIEHYFVGPRDLEKHSKLPYFLRLHGSVMPKMIVKLTLIMGWTTAITCISKFVHELAVSSLLLTILGFLVGLSLSFINSTAYERYSEGRKAWASLTLQSRNLARLTWVHIKERPDTPEAPHQAKEDLLAKITALNLILAFAVALKHRIRFEPHVHYEDLKSLVGHLDTFAKAASSPDHVSSKKSIWKSIGEYLGLPFAVSNPRKEMKRASKPLGNLPFEIATYLSAYYEEAQFNTTLSSPVVYGQILGHLAALIDVLTQTERVASTPLPEAYSIMISQITLIYVLTLPFQLYSALGWITIPGTLAAAYIILGIAAIGHEIENPFGHDVNDLPLDAYCRELKQELDIIMAEKPPVVADFVARRENLVLWPLSASGLGDWRERDERAIREALRAKVVVGLRGRRR